MDDQTLARPSVVLSARAYASQLVEMQTAAHTYYLAAGQQSTPVLWRAMATAAARAMDAAWSIAEHHARTAYADPDAHRAWCTIAQRWTRSAEGTLRYLPTLEGATLKAQIDNWRALRQLPVVPDMGVTACKR